MNFKQGDKLKIESKGVIYEGIFMPSITKNIVLKLDSGYNVGVNPDGAKISRIKNQRFFHTPIHSECAIKNQRFFHTPIRSECAIKEKESVIENQKDKTSHKCVSNDTLPKISILSTGGTIASKIDYRTGAVTAQFSADDILNSIPELKEIACVSCGVVYNILSENMKLEYWVELGNRVVKEIEADADGIIIAHGTDTMAYTAAALSFMIDTPVPIVFVGSQRSADRPSSDNAMNAICAALVSVSDIAEVVVVMHGTGSDDYCEIHSARRVRKMHTSRRDAFKSINSKPIGIVDYMSREVKLSGDYNKRGETVLNFKDGFESKCALIKFTPGLSFDILSHYIDKGYKGIVIEGTGLGHVSTDWVPEIKRAIKLNIPIVMTSQCLNGSVCDRVYDTGMDLLKAGVIEGGDMLPEVALVKLMWVRGQTNDFEEIVKLMRN